MLLSHTKAVAKSLCALRAREKKRTWGITCPPGRVPPTPCKGAGRPLEPRLFSTLQQPCIPGSKVFEAGTWLCFILRVSSLEVLFLAPTHDILLPDLVAELPVPIHKPCPTNIASLFEGRESALMEHAAHSSSLISRGDEKGCETPFSGRPALVNLGGNPSNTTVGLAHTLISFRAYVRAYRYLVKDDDGAL